MLDITKHKIVLAGILKDIYSDHFLGPVLGFKGGTACYFLYGLTRFSVDLDFNLLDFQLSKVAGKVISILGNYGSIRETAEKRNTLFFLLSYQKNMQNIKVEISKRRFPDNYEIKNLLGIPLLVMKKEDMFAHKLVALLDRKNMANRDLFDIWFFMKARWDANPLLIEMRTKMEYNEYLEKCYSAIAKVNNRYILQGMGELLNEKQKIWVKKNLKNELLLLMNIYKGQEYNQ